MAFENLVEKTMENPRFHSPHICLIGILGLLLQSSPRPAQATDVLTQHYNNGRTGATLDETVLNKASVGSSRFGKLWTLYADGQVVAQPLYVSGLSIDTTGNPNIPLV